MHVFGFFGGNLLRLAKRDLQLPSGSQLKARACRLPKQPLQLKKTYFSYIHFIKKVQGQVYVTYVLTSVRDLFCYECLESLIFSKFDTAS